MSKYLLCLLLLPIVMPSNAGQSVVKPNRVQLLEVGEFHGDEVNARTSSGWLGLFVSKKTSTLRLTSIRISRVFDPIVDDGTKKITGKRVRVPQSTAPLFLIKNAPILMPGSVKTVLAKPTSLTNGESIGLELEKQQYRIQVESNATNKKIAFGNAKVQLVMGGVEQTLFPNLSKDEGGFSIIWAGDLDGDGKLDLYINAAPHDNIESKRLLLSSQAEKGQLVREVARFEITGC